MANPNSPRYTRAMARTRQNARKLLVAGVGVAAVNYAIACSNSETSGNLVAPPADDSGSADAESDAFVGSGNLVPPEPEDAGSDAKDASDEDAFVGSGNLVPPDPDQ